MAFPEAFDIDLRTTTHKVYASPGQFLEWICLAGANLSASEEELLDAILVGASRAIDEDCRRNFYLSDVDEVRVLDGRDQQDLIVDVTAVTSVSLDGTELTAGPTADYVLWPARPVEGWPYRRIRRIGGVWPEGVQNISVTATWGWEGVPQNIYLSCMNRVKTMWQTRKKSNLMRVQDQGGFKYERWSSKGLRDQERREVWLYTRALDSDVS